MTASELKYQHETHHPESYFFTRKSMNFFGDTMSNFGVRATVVDTWSDTGVEVWELYRKRLVKYGVRGSFYFDKKTFKRVHEKGSKP